MFQSIEFLIVLYLCSKIYSEIQLPPPFNYISPIEKQTNCYNFTNNICIQLCKLGCASCIGLDQCQSCMYGYFIYTTPSQTIQCLKCPYYDDWISVNQGVQNEIMLTLKCKECYEEPHKWELTRQCQNAIDYIFGEFYPSQQQFYEVYYFELFKGEYRMKTFTGCSQIQSSDLTDRKQDLGLKTSFRLLNQDRNSQENSPSFNSFDYIFQNNGPSYYVLTNICIQCHDGFYLNYSSQICIQCSLGCSICQMYAEFAVCITCTYGYALAIDQTCVQCSYDCQQCYYGNSKINVSQVIQNYNIKENGRNILLRCQLCKNELQIPNFDQLSCVNCEQNCKRCEFVNQDGDRLTYKNQINTNSGYIKKCYQCEIGYFPHWNGQECQICYIFHCEKCYWGNETSIGTANQFSSTIYYTTNPGWQILCLQCNYGYILNQYKTKCVQNQMQDQSCAKWQSDGNSMQCSQCQDGLLDQNNLCSGKCSDYLGDFQCLSCYSYLYQKNILYQCIQCVAGMYPTIGGCKKCSDGCISCNEWAYNLNFTSYLIYDKPKISTYFRQIYQQFYKLNPTTYCSSCDASGLYQWKDGSCKTCGTSCGRNQCLIKDDQLICKHCTLGYGNTDDFGQYYTISSNLIDCTVCPYGCISCSDRSVSEIKSKNAVFDIENQYYIYTKICTQCVSNGQFSFRSQFQRCLECAKYNTACSKKLVQSIIIDCNQTNTENRVENGTTIYSFQNLFDGSNGIVEFYLSQYENEILFKFYNLQLIEEFEYNVYFLTLPNQQCTFQGNFVFITYIPVNVFAITSIKINIDTIDEHNNIGTHKAIFELFKDLTFKHFSHVSIKNIDIIQSEFGQKIGEANGQKYFGIQLIDPPVQYQLEFTNSILNGEFIGSYQAVFVIEIHKLTSLNIKNIQFNNFNFISQSPFNFVYSQTDQLQFESNIQQIIFKNSTFEDNIILQISIRNSLFKINYLTFENCYFDNSTIIKDNSVMNGQTPLLKIYLNQFTLFNNTFINSRIMDVQNAHQILSQNWTFSGQNVFKSNSDTVYFGVIMVNTIQMSNLVFEPGVIIQNMSIFYTPRSVQSLLAQDNLIMIFLNIQIDSMECLGLYYCLLDITTPTSIYITQKSNIKINLISIRGTNDNQNSSQSATNLIRFSGLNAVVISDLTLLDNSNINLFTIQQCNNLFIRSSICGRSNDTNVNHFFEHMGQISLTNYSQIKNLNLKLHCKCFLIDLITNAIVIQNMYLSNALTIGHSLVSLGDTSNEQSTTYYYLYDIIVINNILCIDSKQTVIAPILAQSYSKIMAITLKDSQFRNNFLHTFNNDIVAFYESSCVILIDSIISSIQSSNIITYNNTALYNQNNFLVKVQQITIVDSIFSYGNYYYQGKVKNILTMQNKGGLLNIQSEQLIIRNTQFSYSFADIGGAIYFMPQGIQGQLLIRNSSFINTSTSISNQVTGNGGAIYIDGINSILIFNFTENSIKNSQAKQFGGCFFFNMGRFNSQIYILNSQFSEVFAIGGSVLYGAFPQLDEGYLYFHNNLVSGMLPIQINAILEQMINEQNAEFANQFQYSSLITLIQTNIDFNNNIFRDIYYQRIIYLQQCIFSDQQSLYTNYNYLKWPMIDIQGYSGDQNKVNITNCNYINSNRCDWCYKLNYTTQYNPVQYYSDMNMYPNFIIGLQNSNLTISNSSFIRLNCNFCQNGNIYIYDSNFSVSYSRFSNNIAKYGGSIYFSPLLQTKRRLQENQFISYMKNSYIAYNQAIMGGGIYLSNSIIQLIDMTFEYNEALKSGGAIYAQTSQVNLTRTEIILNKAQVAGGIRFVSSIYIKNYVNYINNYASIAYNDDVDYCVLGEYSVQDKCVDCPYGTYTVKDKQLNCKTCQSSYSECLGGSTIRVFPGYWRTNKTSDLIVSCYVEPLNCIGGTDNQICAKGHIGALCEQCDYYGLISGVAYVHSSSYSCEKCADISQNNSLMMVFITIITLLFVAFTVKSNMSDAKQITQAHFIKKMKWTKGQIVAVSQTGVYIKLFTYYLQIIQVIETFNLSIPLFIQEATSATGNPVKQILFSMDCIFLQINSSGMKLTYFRLIWSIIIPIIYFLVIISGYIIKKLIKKQHIEISILHNSLIFIFLYYQPSLIFAFVSMASCRLIAEEDYIKADVTQICYSDEHIIYMVSLLLPVLILLVFVIPLMMLKLLQQNKNKLDNIQVVLCWGMLYNEYKKTTFFWEFMKIFEKTMIIIFLNFYDTYIITKGIIIYLIVIQYGIFSDRKKPYEKGELNKVDLLSTSICSVTILLGITAYNNPLSYIQIICYVFMIIINAFFLMNIFSKIFKAFYEQFENKLEYIIIKISKICPKISKIFGIRRISRNRITQLWSKLSNFTWYHLKKKQFKEYGDWFQNFNDQQKNKISSNEQQQLWDNSDEKQKINSQLYKLGSNIAIFEEYDNYQIDQSKIPQKDVATIDTHILKQDNILQQQK